MQTILSVARSDSGGTVQLAVGDELQITLPERQATAGWKTEVEGAALVAATASDEKAQYWEIGEDTQTSVHVLRAAQEGRAVVTSTYQAMGASGMRVLDTFTLEVTVGAPPKSKPQRERLPVPEMVLMLIEFLVVGLVGVFFSALLALWRPAHEASSQEFQRVESLQMFVGGLGCVLFGTVAFYALLRFLKMAIMRRLK